MIARFESPSICPVVRLERYIEQPTSTLASLKGFSGPQERSFTNQGQLATHESGNSSCVSWDMIQSALGSTVSDQGEPHWWRTQAYQIGCSNVMDDGGLRMPKMVT